MGGSNNICSDKTGTLTKNVMTVMEIYSEGKTGKRSERTLESFADSTVKVFCEG